MKSTFKDIGGIFPTSFDLPEMWRLNASRCGGRFNKLFFWAYPVVGVILIPYTLLCLIEHWLSA